MLILKKETKGDSMKNEQKCRNFRKFERMMKVLGGVTMAQAEKLGLDMDLIEEHGEYASIKACYPNQPLIDQILAKHNLHVVTRSIIDVDCDGVKTIDCYASGFYLSDREDWILVRKNIDAICEEKNYGDTDDDMEESDEE
jgi:hypothetical protein